MLSVFYGIETLNLKRMDNVRKCLKCKEIVTFCECDESIADKDAYIEYLEQVVVKINKQITKSNIMTAKEFLKSKSISTDEFIEIDGNGYTVMLVDLLEEYAQQCTMHPYQHRHSNISCRIVKETKQGKSVIYHCETDGGIEFKSTKTQFEYDWPTKTNNYGKCNL